MNTSLKVILSAIGIAVLASSASAVPLAATAVTAESVSNSDTAPPAIANAHGSVAKARGSISKAHGSVSRNHSERVTRGHDDGSQTRSVEDCVHVTFPQCGGDPTQVDSNRP